MDKTHLRFGEGAHPLLRSLQSRVDQLPKESLNFVAALMSLKNFIAPPLSDLIFGMIHIRNGIVIEPIHQALATMVALRGNNSPEVVAVRNEKMALIYACGANKAADTALEFLFELPTLLDTEYQAQPKVDR